MEETVGGRSVLCLVTREKGKKKGIMLAIVFFCSPYSYDSAYDQELDGGNTNLQVGIGLSAHVILGRWARFWQQREDISGPKGISLLSISGTIW